VGLSRRLYVAGVRREQPEVIRSQMREEPVLRHRSARSQLELQPLRHRLEVHLHRRLLQLLRIDVDCTCDVVIVRGSALGRRLVVFIVGFGSILATAFCSTIRFLPRRRRIVVELRLWVVLVPRSLCWLLLVGRRARRCRTLRERSRT